MVILSHNFAVLASLSALAIVSFVPSVNAAALPSPARHEAQKSSHHGGSSRPPSNHGSGSSNNGPNANANAGSGAGSTSFSGLPGLPSLGGGVPGLPLPRRSMQHGTISRIHHPAKNAKQVCDSDSYPTIVLTLL